MSPLGFEIVAAEPSPLGMIILRQRVLASEPGGVVAEITLDHQFLMSSRATASERALSSLAIAWHGGRDLRVLVGGLGLGYTAHEALASDRVARVEVVELLEPVANWMRDGLVPLSSALAPELRPGGRLAIRLGDVYAELREAPNLAYDLILVDVDHSPDEPLGAPNEAFHSARGAALAGEHLAPDGVLAVWSYAPNDAFADALRDTFREVDARPVGFFNPVTEERETNWIFLARGPARGMGEPSGPGQEPR
jgi:spermidine synthase